MRYLNIALQAAALGFLVAASAQLAQAGELAAAPTPAESFTSGTLHVDRYGSGAQSVILIPGLNCGPWVWYGTIAHLEPSYTVYAITLPGFDGQPSTDKRPLFETVSNDFWKLLDDRHITSPVVVGHSLGGTLAIYLAEQHPERLKSIVALDGLPVFPTTVTMTPEQRSASAQKVAALYAALSPEQLLAGSIAYMRSATMDPALVQPAAALEAKSDPKATAAWVEEDMSNDWRPELAKISIPMLEVMPYEPSPKNPYTQGQTLSFYQMILAGAPNAKVVAIAPSRHFAMLDQPERFYALLDAFLTAP